MDENHIFHNPTPQAGRLRHTHLTFPISYASVIWVKHCISILYLKIRKNKKPKREGMSRRRRRGRRRRRTMTIISLQSLLLLSFHPPPQQGGLPYTTSISASPDIFHLLYRINPEHMDFDRNIFYNTWKSSCSLLSALKTFITKGLLVKYKNACNYPKFFNNSS